MSNSTDRNVPAPKPAYYINSDGRAILTDVFVQYDGVYSVSERLATTLHPATIPGFNKPARIFLTSKGREILVPLTSL